MKRRSILFLCVLAVVALAFSFLSLPALADKATLNYLTFSDATLDGSTATMSVTGKNTTTKDITITNSSDYEIEIKFNYSGRTAGGTGDTGSFSDFTLTNASIISNADGYCVMTIKSKGSFKVTLTTKDKYYYVNGTSTYYLYITVLEQKIICSSTDLIVNYDSNLGNVTHGGSAVTAGSTITDIAKGQTLIATTNSGATFLAWIDANGNIITRDATYTVNPTTDAMTVKAAFASASSNAWFWVDGKYLTDNLNTATTLGSSIILAADGVLPAVSGGYTIPSGDSVLIPYSPANIFRGVATEWYLKDADLFREGFPGSPEVSIISMADRASTSKTEYRRLTMAEGATIVIANGGSLEVSGQSDGFGAGQHGAYGLIQMASGSRITVENGGTLFVWGYIRGSGSVTANSGSTVYEHLNIADYPGGGAGGMDSLNSEGVFAFRDFTLNSVEVEMTINTGASFKIYTCVTGFKIGTCAFIRTLVGPSSDAMFQLTSGTIKKAYVNGRQKLGLSGDASINSFSIAINFAVVDYELNSANTSGLPFGKSWDITATNGTEITLNNNIVMYAGATMTIDEGAKLIIPAGINAYIMDVSSDSYTAATSNAMIDVNGEVLVTSGDFTKNEVIYKSGIYTSYYTDESGNITNYASIISSKGTGKITISGNVGTDTTVKIRGTDDNSATCNITPAKLKNANPSTPYTETATGGTGIYTYCLHCGMWWIGTHSCVTGWLTNVSLANNLHMYFAFNTELEPGNYKATVTHYYADGTVKTEPINTLTAVTINSKTYVQLIYEGVAAKEMVDAVYVTLYDSQNKVVSFWGDSIREYAHRLYKLNSTSDALKALIVDMLNYGAACQVQFQYNIGSLANNKLSELGATAKTYVQKSFGALNNDLTASNISIAQRNLEVASNIQFHIAFNGNVVGKTAIVTFTGHKNNPVEQTLTVDSNGCIQISGMVVADFNQEIKITIEGTEMSTKIIDYITNMGGSETNNVFYAFSEFAASAYAYLNPNAKA